MYSRYSGIKVPQNYSGSRFSIETETKLHTATQPTGIKNAHSPSFVTSMKQKSSKENLDKDYESLNNNIEEIEAGDSYEDTYYDESPIANEPTSEASLSVDKRDNHSSGLDFSFLKGLLDKVSLEELLILGVILLIATDKDSSFDSSIWILGLLLLANN